MYFTFALLMLLPQAAKSAVINADTISISTIGGQGISNGIMFSSYIYITSGSSLTLQGSAGYITNSSSVNASAFFGDGSHLTGVGNAFQASTQTFTGMDTFTSSFAVQSQGRQIILSTSNTANNVSINSDGAISFYPALHNSSATIVPEASTTNTQFGPCIAGSTITLTTSGGKVELVFSGVLATDTTGQSTVNLAMNFLQDGQYIGNLSATKGFVANGLEYSFASQMPIRVSYLLDPPTAGSHSYCVTIAAQSGTDTILIESTSSNLFYVKEIK